MTLRHIESSDDESDSSSSYKQALKPLASMEDIRHPMTDDEKARLKHAGKQPKKLSDYIQRPATKIVVTARKKLDPARATRRYDKTKKKIVTEIPTKEVKMVTIEREVKQMTEGESKSAKRKRPSSPSRTDKDLALDYAEEICDKSDDYQELVRKLANTCYYEEFASDDDRKMQHMVVQLLDRAIANANRSVNAIAQIEQRKNAQTNEDEKEEEDEKEDDPPAKRHKKDTKKSSSSKSSTKKKKHSKSKAK